LFFRFVCLRLATTTLKWRGWPLYIYLFGPHIMSFVGGHRALFVNSTDFSYNT
jgi:hypothetical protein